MNERPAPDWLQTRLTVQPELKKSTTPEERRALSLSQPKCSCGNALSLYRVQHGVKLCPQCDLKSEKQIQRQEDANFLRGLATCLDGLWPAEDLQKIHNIASRLEEE